MYCLSPWQKVSLNIYAGDVAVNALFSSGNYGSLMAEWTVGIQISFPVWNVM